MVQILEVMDDGEVHEIKDEEKPIKELLNSDRSYIINDDDKRIVYLWKGSECSVRSKFIGAQKLQEVRGQVGLNYSTIAMDEEEQDEHPKFLEAIEETRSDGFAQEIVEDQDLQFEVGGGPTKTRTYQEVMSRAKSGQYNETIEQSGPLYKGDDSEAPVSGSPATQEFSQDKLDEILEVLDEEGVPEGYEREMIIMGPKAYSVAEKKQTFLGKEQVEKVLEPISSLPEGIFFAEGYVPRVLVENKTVVAIEFLKKEE